MTHLYIKMSGSPYERGLQYGTQAKELIHKLIEEYKLLFDKENHIAWETAYKKAAAFEEPIRSFRPDLIEEMKGIADGAEIDLQTVLVLNCRSEIMFTDIPSNEDACTVIGVPPEVSKTGHTLLAQNWDWWTVGEGTTVILEVEQEGYAKSLIVTEAGLVGGKGLNEYGVALSMNAMSVNGGKIGVPLQVVLRAALSCSTVPKAIDCIAKCPRAGCACVGLASWDGELVMVEYAPNDLDILLCDGKALCHTNHWQSLKMILGPEARNYSYISTFTRLDRARRLTKDKKKLTPKKLFAILSDHAGYPDGICRHDDPDLPYYHCHSSLWSMVIDTVTRTLYITDGTPCRSKPEKYILK